MIFWGVQVQPKIDDILGVQVQLKIDDILGVQVHEYTYVSV